MKALRSGAQAVCVRQGGCHGVGRLRIERAVQAEEGGGVCRRRQVTADQPRVERRLRVWGDELREGGEHHRRCELGQIAAGLRRLYSRRRGLAVSALAAFGGRELGLFLVPRTGGVVPAVTVRVERRGRIRWPGMTGGRSACRGVATGAIQAAQQHAQRGNACDDAPGRLSHCADAKTRTHHNQFAPCGQRSATRQGV